MRAYRITWAARQDLREIVGYVAAENRAAASRVREALFAAFEMLAERPGIGHVRDDLTAMPVRFWTVLGRYSIVYRRDGEEPLEVVRVLGPGRDVATLLK